MSDSPFERLVPRDDDFDGSDLSYITSIAAIGDSYSAGIGAGSRLGFPAPVGNNWGDWECSRYDEAYPYLVNSDARLGDPAARTFQFQSCSGAVIADVLTKQIPNINSNQQVILISAGGNDVELTNILNQCIFQWAVFNSEQATVGKIEAALESVKGDDSFKWAENFDWDKLSRGCEGQLLNTETLIAGNAFSQSLDSVISAAKAKLAPSGTIYYTGYAKFWAEDLSPECDSVTWTTWIFKAYNLFQPAEKLTRDHRATMNKLVDAINAQISAAVERAGPNVKFVNYDPYVGRFGGRFCEKGVDESTTASNTRDGLMFYELNTWDIFGDSPWKRDTDPPLDGTFHASVTQLAQLALLLDPDAQFTHQAAASVASTEAAVFASTKESEDIHSLETINPLPDGYGRVFHPQVLLHEIIASLVVFEMVNTNERQHGEAESPEIFTFDSCPYYPPSPGTSLPGSGDSGDGASQQIALASYINPNADPDAWVRLLSYDSNKVSVLVANILNGPDYALDKAWKSVIDQAAGQGTRVIGYVRTGYLGVSQQQFTTRLGSHDLADWTTQIQQDVDKWYELYGSTLGGIFFDEGWPECGPDNIYAKVYTYINNYTKRRYPGAFTVLNPGSPIAQCFEDTMDTLLTFENSYEAYQSQYVPNDWTPQDSRKIWHIIFKVPQDQVATIATLAASRHAGLLEITDDDQPNPYDTLPKEAYMQAFMGAIPGGKPRIANPPDAGGSYVPGLPADVAISTSDYSSVTLTWSLVANALGYAVFMDGTQIAELPPFMTRSTISMLEPGTSGIKFEVVTRLATSSGSGASRILSGSTKSLPDSGTVSNVGYTTSGTTITYTADVLIPYGFVRLFIGKKFGPLDIEDGWPIFAPLVQGQGANYQIANYMVEGNSFYSGFYKYTGNWHYGKTEDAGWNWASIGTAPQTQNGYTYTWTVPLAGTDAQASNYVIQCQGYAPIKNVFKGTIYNN